MKGLEAEKGRRKWFNYIIIWRIVFNKRSNLETQQRLRSCRCLCRAGRSAHTSHTPHKALGLIVLFSKCGESGYLLPLLRSQLLAYVARIQKQWGWFLVPAAWSSSKPASRVLWLRWVLGRRPIHGCSLHCRVRLRSCAEDRGEVEFASHQSWVRSSSIANHGMPPPWGLPKKWFLSALPSSRDSWLAGRVPGLSMKSYNLRQRRQCDLSALFLKTANRIPLWGCNLVSSLPPPKGHLLLPFSVLQTWLSLRDIYLNHPQTTPGANVRLLCMWLTHTSAIAICVHTHTFDSFSSWVCVHHPLKRYGTPNERRYHSA